MKNVTLGSTGITVPQNGFGALPVQRVSTEEAAHLIRKAYDGGMRFFDTARAYSDSEEKVGKGLEGIDRSSYYLATKSMASNTGELEKQMNESLRLLKTDYVDIYQFHCVDKVYRPGDGSGMYEFMEKAKADGKIRHIGITTHKLKVAQEIIKSGLYETLQYPMSYLSTPEEIKLIEECKNHNMGFIAMKGLAGGLINQYKPAMAFMNQFDNVIPIWGIQKEEELDQWLSCFEKTPEMDEELSSYIEKEKLDLSGDFCRGCGYCMPCPVGITINQCARMSLMLRRAPSKSWLNEHWQQEMAKIEDCLNCRQCVFKCPYSLNTPGLLKKNLEDYRNVLAGETTVD